MAAYYNEIDEYAAQWLRNLIAAGYIAPGDVDTRSIVNVRPADLTGYTQCHFFAGIGGWSYAARLADWPDNRPIWTGSCPCQPFSVAGKGEGQTDTRHLWPEFFRLIAACRPPVVMGEQVAAAVGKHWLDGVHSDLEGIGYACRAAVVPACAVDAPHRRDRLWFVADSGSADQRRHAGDARGAPVASGGEAWAPDGYAARGARDARGSGDEDCGPVADADFGGPCSRAFDPSTGHGHPVATDEREGPWASAGCLLGADGKVRRVEPGIRLLAHGVPARVGKLRAYGNAIVPQVAAEVIGAYLDTCEGA